jgi:hypothetical protein
MTGEGNMDIDQLRAFFFWCMVINIGIYGLALLAVWVMRDFITRMQMKIVGLDENTVHKTMYRYLASYRLLITTFNFAPWIALLIIK